MLYFKRYHRILFCFAVCWDFIENLKPWPGLAGPANLLLCLIVFCVGSLNKYKYHTESMKKLTDSQWMFTRVEKISLQLKNIAFVLFGQKNITHFSSMVQLHFFDFSGHEKKSHPKIIIVSLLELLLWRLIDIHKFLQLVHSLCQNV